MAIRIKRLKMCMLVDAVISLLGIVPEDTTKDVGKIELPEYSLECSLKKSPSTQLVKQNIMLSNNEPLCYKNFEFINMER